MRAALALLALLSGSAFAQTNLIVNGGFEDNGGLGTNVFAGWTVYNQIGGSGSWLVQNGTHPSGFDCKDDVVQAPPSGFAAMTSQSDPGTHVLYQDVTIPGSAAQVMLSFDLYYNTFGDLMSPPSLDFHTRPNQQFRADIVDPSAPIEDVGSGVLANVYQTLQGDTPELPGYKTITDDLSRFAGRTVRLRFAEVDHGACFHVGIDNVAITVSAACPTSAPGVVMLGYRGGSSNCGASEAPCITGERITFSPSTTGYAFEACDTYAWDFGDGATSSTLSPTHTYVSAGTYTVRFTITNPLGTRSADPEIVTVDRAPRRRAAGH